MAQRFKVTVELSIHQGSTDSTIKERFVEGLTDMSFYDLKFQEFEKISFTKEEAIQKILSLPGVHSNFVDVVAEIIGRIS